MLYTSALFFQSQYYIPLPQTCVMQHQLLIQEGNPSWKTVSVNIVFSFEGRYEDHVMLKINWPLFSCLLCWWWFAYLVNNIYDAYWLHNWKYATAFFLYTRHIGVCSLLSFSLPLFFTEAIAQLYLYRHVSSKPVEKRTCRNMVEYNTSSSAIICS